MTDLLIGAVIGFALGALVFVGINTLKQKAKEKEDQLGKDIQDLGKKL